MRIVSINFIDEMRGLYMVFVFKGFVFYWERNIKNNFKIECKVIVVSGIKKKIKKYFR